MKNQHPPLSDDELRKMGQFVAALNEMPLPKFADIFPPESVFQALSEATKIDSKHLFDAASTMSLMADTMPPDYADFASLVPVSTTAWRQTAAEGEPAAAELPEVDTELADAAFPSLAVFNELLRHNPEWATQWRGALHALADGGPDHARHVASSVRAILWAILDQVAPGPGSHRDRIRAHLESKRQGKLAAICGELVNEVMALSSALDKKETGTPAEAVAVVSSGGAAFMLILSRGDPSPPPPPPAATRT